MNQDQYGDEVAFSFLALDEGLATKLNDLLQDRLSTFLHENPLQNQDAPRLPV